MTLVKITYKSSHPPLYRPCLLLLLVELSTTICPEIYKKAQKNLTMAYHFIAHIKRNPSLTIDQFNKQYVT